jgi:hypothetical protein
MLLAWPVSYGSLFKRVELTTSSLQDGTQAAYGYAATPTRFYKSNGSGISWVATCGNLFAVWPNGLMSWKTHRAQTPEEAFLLGSSGPKQCAFDLGFQGKREVDGAICIKLYSKIQRSMD